MQYYIGLVDGSLEEIIGGGYERQPISLWDPRYEIHFPKATSDWGIIIGYFIADSPTGPRGEIIFFRRSRTIAKNDYASLIGLLNFTD